MRYLKGKYVRADSVTVRSAKPWQLAHSWTTEKDLPCGRFRLVAYSPHYGVDWVMNWQETGKRSLEGMIPVITRSLEGAVRELQALKDAADEAAAKREREWQEAQERSRREQDRRQVAQALTDSRKQLAEIMEKWAAAKSVERFFIEAEARLQDVEDERRERLEGRLALARSMLGTLDPLEFLEGWIAPEERYTTKYPTG